MEITLRKTLSAKNCRISSLLLEPTTFLRLTSLARLMDRAVERFMKLMEATTRMKKRNHPEDVEIHPVPMGL